MRRAAKVDDTQKAIVEALRAAGARVLSLAAVGKGCPDLLVYMCTSEWRVMCLMEVKNLEGKGLKLTQEQIAFHHKWPVIIVTSPKEALEAIGL